MCSEGVDTVVTGANGGWWLCAADRLTWIRHFRASASMDAKMQRLVCCFVCHVVMLQLTLTDTGCAISPAPMAGFREYA